MIATLERGMAKKAGRPKGTRNDVTVKVDEDVVDQARIVAAFRKIPLSELVSDLLREPVKRAHAEMVKSLNRNAKGGDE